MNVYITTLFYAIPAFSILILIEEIAARIKGVTINNSPDMISSLSSGLTNTLKDAVKFSFLIVSYSLLVDKIAIFEIKSLWLIILIAFIVEDFAGYWMHRLHHRVNVFWNRHVIHHSSEEFNLSCALRQSISTIFKFSAVLMIPAALIGVPASIFAILAPIHLFMQFWYHTRLINKMGFLEYILVTPSHHRVHHAINKEYLDKNYSQIFIIWDKLFGTFQKELEDVRPVYGILRPAKTWNPVIINFKHFIQLLKDAWHAQNLKDKLKIWFMPTGWRPEDVNQNFSLKQVNDPYQRVKYATNNSIGLLIFSWIQFFIANLFMFHLFLIIQDGEIAYYYWYAIFITIHIFSFTATLDHKKYAIIADIFKMIIGFGILYFYNNFWFDLNQNYSYVISIYLLLSCITTYYFIKIKS